MTKNEAMNLFLLSSDDVDISATDKNGKTALHLACVRGYVDCVEMLVNEDNQGSINKQSDTLCYVSLH